jgi:nucleotide-binding universal stress UspA family protein
MAIIERILCPVDFSEGSRRAVDHALAIARWDNASVTALHVTPPRILAPYIDPRVNPPPIGRTRDELENLRLQLALFVEQESGDFSVASVVKEGLVAGEILRFAEASRADVVVMGTHGRSGFQRLILGSVTESVLRHAACPVLTVPPGVADAVPVGPELFRRILCAVDFSAPSLRALDYASSLAQEGEASLTVLHVFEPVADYVAVTVGGVDNKAMQAAAERHLHTLVAGRANGSGEVITMLAVGKPGREILEVAEAQQIDLIVLGVAGRGAADIFWFGSTANQVVRRASCPVLTLRK